MKVYDTESGRIEDFVPRDPGRVSMYVCGPTVYAPPHLGHARMAITFDIIRKYFAFAGYAVRFVSNYTDIDDKIIRKAEEEGADPAGVAERYERAWDEAMDRLGVDRPDAAPHATEYVGAMIEMIARLINRGHAYEANGDVYFAVRSFEPYGRLSHQKLADLEVGARVEPGEHKRDPLDFALWKAAKAGEPFWESPWGPGRPGWHIECSVMSISELGMGFDIHGAGSDLVFPHHENEIAQAEAALGEEPFVRYWLHSGMMRLQAEKMSKSTGNILLIDDVLERHSAEAVRLLVAQTHYRSPLDLADELIEEAERAVDRLGIFRDRGAAALGVRSEGVLGCAEVLAAEPDPVLMEAFRAAMDDDFHTPGAVAAIFDMVRRANAALDQGETGALRAQLAALAAVDTVLSVVPPAGPMASSGALAAVVDLLLDVRDRARSIKDFETSDLIRARLTELGFIVEDTAEGSRWRRRRRT